MAERRGQMNLNARVARKVALQAADGAEGKPPALSLSIYAVIDASVNALLSIRCSRSAPPVSRA